MFDGVRAAVVALFALVTAACAGGGGVVDAALQPDAGGADAEPVDAGADADARADAPALVDVSRTPLGRDARYCELLLAFAGGGSTRVEVWGTQSLNDCPAAAWDAVDTAAVRRATGATVVLRNGPRVWLPDRTSAMIPDRAPMYFGALLMQQLASIELPAGMLSSMPYAERTVLRDTRFEIDAGREVYELTAPDGAVYVMQSYAQIIDPALSASDLPGLASRLRLPSGWSYRARTLDALLVVTTPGMATVIQDDLQNSYSRRTDGR